MDRAIKNADGDDIDKIEPLTVAEYEALETRDKKTLYLIILPK